MLLLLLFEKKKKDVQVRFILAVGEHLVFMSDEFCYINWSAL